MEEKVNGKLSTKITGSFDATPFNNEEITYFKALAYSITSQFIDKGELVKKIENNQTELELETKSE